MDAVISIDLLEAARRSDSFPAEWPQDKVERAVLRYRRFLALTAKHGGPMAPTRDIDEVWHLHMLAPRAYYNDCLRLFGEVLDHDGGFGKGDGEVPLLQATFERTATLWAEEYGETYLLPESEYNSRHAEGAGHSCWHQCQSQCWHSCSQKTGVAQVVASQ